LKSVNCCNNKWQWWLLSKTKYNTNTVSIITTATHKAVDKVSLVMLLFKVLQQG
jgi:hypothetical protein